MLPLYTTRDFVCVSPHENTIILWVVNESVIIENTKLPDGIAIAYQKLPDGSTQSNLTFRADAEGNNTNIRCVITSFSDPYAFLNYTITIQGEYLIINIIIVVVQDFNCNLSRILFDLLLFY